MTTLADLDSLRADDLVCAIAQAYSLPTYPIWVTHMKTTLDISDDLFARSRKLAQREGTTLRAVVEEGLRLALKARAAKPPRSFRFPTHAGGGFQAGFEMASWSQIRDAIYEDAHEKP